MRSNSILRQCDSCCRGEDTPELIAYSVSRSATKVGFEEFISSYPPRIYRTIQWAGVLSQTYWPYGSDKQWGETHSSTSWGGYITKLPVFLGGDDPNTGDPVVDCTSTLYSHHSSSLDDDWQYYGCDYEYPGVPAGNMVNVSPTRRETDWYQGCGGGGVYPDPYFCQSGGASATLVNEYTTGELIDFNRSEIDSLPWDTQPSVVAQVENGRVVSVAITERGEFGSLGVLSAWVGEGNEGDDAQFSYTTRPKAGSTKLELDTITVTNPGSGYSVAPSLLWLPYSYYGASASKSLHSSERSSAMSKALYHIRFQPTTKRVTWVERFIPAEGVPISGFSITKVGSNLALARCSVISPSGFYGNAWGVISGSAISSILFEGGFGYSSPPTITVGDPRVGGTRAIAEPIMGVGNIYVRTRGNGYTTPPEVVISGGGGSGAKAVAKISRGQVSSIEITDNGTGYTSLPEVSIISQDDGSGATAEVYLRVLSARIIDGGSGYDCVIDIEREYEASGSGASAIVDVDGDIHSSTFGMIRGISVTSGGTGYDATPRVTLVVPPSVAPNYSSHAWTIEARLGIETEKSYAPTGEVPSDYHPDVPASWPRTPDYLLDVPAELGLTVVALVMASTK
jgi:hypothetical protein